ncbi:MAG: hypothetical protein JSW11_01955 [Candidatus Heimdallarchaeota archaeon]|nr:MAG: hypothetical protein JSW11_01955 [Candidatus Heimdallarchaeota archaeon]
MAKKTSTKKVGKKKTAKKKSAKMSDDICFVLAPFQEPFDTYYDVIIEPAVIKAGLKPKRGNSLFLPTPIMGDIWCMIQDAKVVLAELSGKNPNVFYELGLGHAIGKPVVLISESMEDVPFDLQALRVILYDKDDPRWGDRLRNRIVVALQATLCEPVKAVPPIFRKVLKSQAPKESEISLRLAIVESKIDSLRNREIRKRKYAGQYYTRQPALSNYWQNKLTEANSDQKIINWVHLALEEGFSVRSIEDTLRRSLKSEELVVRIMEKAMRDYPEIA